MSQEYTSSFLYPAGLATEVADNVTSQLNNTYLDSLIQNLSLTSLNVNGESVEAITAGTGLTKTGGTLSVNSTQTQVTTVGTLTSLTVAGNTTVNTAPSTSNHVVRKIDLDSAIQSVVSGGAPAVSAGSGLSLTGARLDVLVSDIEFEIDSATNKIRLKDSGISPTKLAMGSVYNFTNTADSTALGTGAMTIAGGLSVSKTVATTRLMFSEGSADKLTIRPISGFYNLGLAYDTETPSATLSRFNVMAGGATAGYQSALYLYARGIAGATDQERLIISASSTGASISWNNVGSTASRALTIYGGTTFNTDNSVTFTGAVTVPTPSSTGHSANKGYVDGLTYLTAGTGLSKTGTTLSVNASQTLTSLTVSGTATVPTPVNSSDATTKAYVDSMALSATLDPSNVLNLTNTTSSTSTTTGALVVAGGIASGACSTLNQVTISGAGQSVGEGPTTGALVVTNGISTSSYLYGATLNISSTIDSTSTLSGSIVTAGGLAVAKTIYCNNIRSNLGLVSYSGTLISKFSGSNASTNTATLTVDAYSGNHLSYLQQWCPDSVNAVTSIWTSSGAFNSVGTTAESIRFSGARINARQPFSIGTAPSTNDHYTVMYNFNIKVATAGGASRQTASVSFSNIGNVSYHVSGMPECTNSSDDDVIVTFTGKTTTGFTLVAKRAGGGTFNGDCWCTVSVFGRL